MNLKQRKKELSEKLEAVEVSKKEIWNHLKDYRVLGIFPFYRKYIENKVEITSSLRKPFIKLKKEVKMHKLNCKYNFPAINQN
ncbi:hypothetical protein KAI04_00605 [Candidatus Pacearchaeota archaeon]|nr:hypothetical protein [Candidatus Pacearchaeota archaeon]